MPAIRILPDNLIDKIAAGEVVERPASVVKELAENALDADATDIAIDVEQAGRRLIRIADNGCGIAPGDVLTAFQRHATSKIGSEQDLESVGTMGFRGEALSSVAAVSQVRMVTAEQGARAGSLVEIHGGTVIAASDAAPRTGTVIEINHLFYNTPARLKFLKSPATEFSHILAVASRLAIARPDVRFRLSHNNKAIFDLQPTTDRAERVRQLYGAEIADNLTTFAGGRDGILVHGLVGRPGYSRADRTHQEFFVNGRAVRNMSLSHALYSAHGDLLMRDRHPVVFLFLDLDPRLVDVNVHPAKAEVRFRNQAQVHDLVRDVVRDALGGRRERHLIEQGQDYSHADRVREAVQEYERSRSEARQDETPSPPFFGRRKRDAEPLLDLTPSSDAVKSGRDAGTPVIPAPGETLYPLAQVHDSFIIAQSREGMAIIDQHAAHERVLFEQLQDQHGRGAIPVQNLLVPLTVELGHAQAVLLREQAPGLLAFGFDVEDFGGNVFRISAVPALFAGADLKALLLDILDDIHTHGVSGRLEAFRDEVLSVMACHPAVKVHRRLGREEMEALLRDLSASRMPHSCPHGRPTVVRFSIDELRKMFKRI